MRAHCSFLPSLAILGTFSTNMWYAAFWLALQHCVWASTYRNCHSNTNWERKQFERLQQWSHQLILHPASTDLPFEHWFLFWLLNASSSSVLWPKKSVGGPKPGDPAPMWETQNKVLAPSLGSDSCSYCSHLGKEPMVRSWSLLSLNLLFN